MATFLSLFDAGLGSCDGRVFERLRRLAVGLLECTERGTISGMIAASGRTESDWSADYRVFSRGRFQVRELFAVIERCLLGYLAPDAAIVVALDDTKFRKTGTKIPGVSYQRDPMSPPFRANLIRAQRFIQTSATVPLAGASGPARAFPIAFEHVPPPPRPGRDASAQEWACYRQRQKTEGLPAAAAKMISGCRQRMDALGATDRRVVVTVDGGYTNATVLRNVPERTTLIGRIRQDAKLLLPPVHQPDRGRKCSYGINAPRPDQLRRDESVPWQQVSVFASGRVHECKVKTLGPVLWRKAGAHKPLLLVVIAPLGYRLHKSGRILYRKPAYLICTDPTMPLTELVQAYFRRWDIEVNHRDEKQLIGVGQAQVRSPESVESVPAFAVAIYSLLMLASAQCYGLAATAPPHPVPSWRKPSTANQVRITTGQIIHAFHHDATPARPRGDLPNFTDFETRLARHLKCPKSQVSREMALAYAMT